MPLPNLDEATKAALNKIEVGKLGSEVGYAVQHEVFGYGIDSVAHVYVMQMAKGVLRGRLTREQLIAKYGLDFAKKQKENGLDTTCAFAMPLTTLEKGGIFIPQQVYFWNDGRRRDRYVFFFESDYINRMLFTRWTDNDYARQLLEREWTQEDLQDPRIVDDGIRFGRDMWMTCLDGFNKGKTDARTPEDRATIDSAEKLVAYLDAIINGDVASA